MDVDSIPYGVDFSKYIEGEVASCDVFLAIIGPSWFNWYRAERDPQPSDLHDFVRIEISAALKRDIPVVPVLLENAAIPAVEALPIDLQPLFFRHGIRVRHETFSTDIQQLADFLRRRIGAETSSRSRLDRSSKQSTAGKQNNAARPSVSPWLGEYPRSILIALLTGLIAFFIFYALGAGSMSNLLVTFLLPLLHILFHFEQVSKL